MDDKLKNKINKLKTFDKDGGLAMFEEIQELNDILDDIKKSFKGLDFNDLEKLKGEKGDKGDRGDVGIGKQGEKGNTGDTGDTPTTKQLLKLIKPLIPQPIKGKDGKDADMESIIREVLSQIPEIDKQELVDNVIKNLPTSGEAIRDSLELLKDEERLDVSAIKGLKKELSNLENKFSQKTVKMIPPSARDMFGDIDLSAQLDGVTKTFNIPAVWNILSVSLSSFPNALRKGVDFTYTPTSITFTSEITAGTSLATGQTCVLTVVHS